MITSEMVKCFLHNEGKADIIKDYKDIANGKYDPVRLRRDIIETWSIKKNK